MLVCCCTGVCFASRDVGFRGLGFRGLGFRGLGVQGLRFRVYGLGLNGSGSLLAGGATCDAEAESSRSLNSLLVRVMHVLGNRHCILACGSSGAKYRA